MFGAKFPVSVVGSISLSGLFCWPRASCGEGGTRPCCSLGVPLFTARDAVFAPSPQRMYTIILDPTPLGFSGDGPGGGPPRSYVYSDIFKSMLIPSAQHCDFWGSKPILSEGFDLFVTMPLLHFTCHSVFVVIFLSAYIFSFSFFFPWSRETPRLFLPHDQDEGKCRDEKNTHKHTHKLKDIKMTVYQ